MRRPKVSFPREGGARLLGTSSAARTPFVLLVVVLLGAGLLALLLLNAAVNQGSFRVSKLKRETTALSEQEQKLRRQIEAQAASDALARRARELGMVPGGPPVFLTPEGDVRGVPHPAPTPASLPRPADAAKPEPVPVGESPKPSESAGPADAAGPDAPAARPAPVHSPAPSRGEAP